METYELIEALNRANLQDSHLSKPICLESYQVLSNKPLELHQVVSKLIHVSKEKLAADYQKYYPDRPYAQQIMDIPGEIYITHYELYKMKSGTDPLTGRPNRDVPLGNRIYHYFQAKKISILYN